MTIALKLFDLIERNILTFCYHQALKSQLVHLNLRNMRNLRKFSDDSLVLSKI